LARLLEPRWRRPGPAGQAKAAPPASAGVGARAGGGAARTVEVMGAQPYRITIGSQLLDDGAALCTPLRGAQALIVSDDTVAPLYADRVEDALRRARPKLALDRLILPAGEASKTLHEFGRAISALATLGARRDACV